MAHKFPPLVWLRSFEASARHLSFTLAAKELNLTQAAVSKQVKQLEFHLRQKLFVRHPRSLEMTKTAESYLPKVRDAFERLSAGTQEVFGNRRSEILTVRAAVGFSVNWLAPRLPKFYAKHPDIPIRLVSSVWNEQVGNPSFDLDVRYGTGNWPDMNADRLTWETITPLCSSDLLKQKKVLQPSDLVGCTLIDVLGYQEGWPAWLQVAGVTNINPGNGLQVDTSLLAFELASSGLGVALARSSMMHHELRTGRLVAPFELTVPIQEAFYLVSSPQQDSHPHLEIFRDWILSETEQGS
jgi:LysR family glycine cleavage system transcriptional activator